MSSIIVEEHESQEALWRTLAAKAQDGDQKAYHRLLSDLVPFVKMRISGKLANPDWIDDVVQDVLVSVHKSLHTYSSDRPFKPWLNSIIQFRKTDFLRKYYRKKQIQEAGKVNADVFSSDVTSIAYKGELKDIEAALDTLPEKQKYIFILLKIEGYSIKDVAKKLDMSESAVKVSVHRSGRKLKKMLVGYE